MADLRTGAICFDAVQYGDAVPARSFPAVFPLADNWRPVVIFRI